MDWRDCETGETVDWRDCGLERLWPGETVDWRDCGLKRLWTGETVDWRDCGLERLWTGCVPFGGGMLFGTCAVGLFDTGCCDGCDGTAPKLMLMLGSKARSPSCQSFTESRVYNTHSHVLYGVHTSLLCMCLSMCVYIYMYVCLCVLVWCAWVCVSMCV